MSCARLLCLAVASLLAAQDVGLQSESRLVIVPAIVTDSKGRPVDGLGASDFTLLDGGRVQAVTVDTFATGQPPLALVVAVQASGISAAALAKVHKIGAMIQPLITGDRGCAGLVAFAERIKWIEECGNDPDKLARAFANLSPAEDTAAHMLDAAYDAIKHLSRRANVRRVLLLISESRDNGSETEIEPVIIAAQAAGVAVYAITYSPFKTAWTAKPSPPPAKPIPQPPPREGSRPVALGSPVPIAPAEQRVDLLGGLGELLRLRKTKTAEVLTAPTGGTILSFARQKGLEQAIEKLGLELHTQYVLSFTPTDPAPGFHTLEVRVPSQYKVRARPTYWSAEHPRY